MKSKQEKLQQLAGAQPQLVTTVRRVQTKKSLIEVAAALTKIQHSLERDMWSGLASIKIQKIITILTEEVLLPYDDASLSNPTVNPDMYKGLQLLLIEED